MKKLEVALSYHNQHMETMTVTPPDLNKKVDYRLAHARINEPDVKTYHREGYLLPTGKLFPDDKFNQLKDHFNAMMANLPPDQRPESMVGPVSMEAPHLTDTKLFDWLFADEVLDLVEHFIGPDIALFSSHFICKREGDGKRVPWHEDAVYWKSIINPIEVVTVWLAIDESTPENGCMYVLPGSHRDKVEGFADYHNVDLKKNIFPIEIVPEQRSDDKAVPCILSAGEVSLHHAKTKHGSPPNFSSKRRCGYTMRYMSTRCQQLEGSIPFHNVYLARGCDLCNQQYADPTKSYDELMERRKARRKGFH